MTPALTLLIASSVGWSASAESRPTRLEVELLVVAVEAEVISETLPPPASTDAMAAPSVSGLPSPGAGLRSPVFDSRSFITYDLALPFFRTKP